MKRNATLSQGDVTLCCKGMTRGAERRRVGHALAHTDAAREEARVVASATLKHAAHARGGGRVSGERGPRNGCVARAEERIQVGAGERGESRDAVREGDVVRCGNLFGDMF